MTEYSRAENYINHYKCRPRRSEDHGEVDYYTHPDNVKIFGFQRTCGDEVITPPETCDGAISATCAELNVSCGSDILVGVPTCTGCQIDTSTCDCVDSSMGGGTYSTD